MSLTVPLSQLYNWITGLLPEEATLYAFYIDGNKDIFNLRQFNYRSDLEYYLFPEIICNDQEPLNFDLYNNLSDEQISSLRSRLDAPDDIVKKFNLRAAANVVSMYDKIILLHSEKNSKDLSKYLYNDYIGVYYWAHAIIARDWYRFAEHDSRLKNVESYSNKKLFLVYNRDWQGSREYRLKFSEMLFSENLINDCQTSIMKISDSGLTPNNYKFRNLKLKPDGFDFLNHYSTNTLDSSVSADYVPYDFCSTYVSVVLETIFDDTKIHLTEKILRPIACGHPFILAAGPHSLEYLRSYGFKTFSPWIDETYDQEVDSVQRLQKIIGSMKQLQSLPRARLLEIYNELIKIAEFNQQRFFSKEFMDQVTNELTNNLKNAFTSVKQTRGKLFLYKKSKSFSKKYARRLAIVKKLRDLRKKY